MKRPLNELADLRMKVPRCRWKLKMLKAKHKIIILILTVGNYLLDFHSLSPQLLFQYPVSQSQPAPFYVGGPMIDSMAGTEPSQQPPPPAPMTPAPPPSTASCSAGPSPSSQGSETSFDCTHCGKSLRSRKNYSKHMFIHSGNTHLLLLHLIFLIYLLSAAFIGLNNESNYVFNNPW